MATERVNLGLAELGKVLTRFQRDALSRAPFSLRQSAMPRPLCYFSAARRFRGPPGEEEISLTDDQQPGSAKPVELPTKSSVR
ncbi:hypothetical protein DES53_112202 [Roseimicrobium gellanilyticum]|uniref:Uncharacterized protein n=1 Tax=Roseimicrobium gellanilyticum TaxID=748857 RepID=A0A366H9K1_9BACT|nr:hypothetical protein DES53_112202 [Roseimicrobium gellanilyticum]